jgi:hypothetical protein
MESRLDREIIPAGRDFPSSVASLAHPHLDGPTWRPCRSANSSPRFRGDAERGTIFQHWHPGMDGVVVPEAFVYWLPAPPPSWQGEIK